jgi:hypothetical protein
MLLITEITLPKRKNAEAFAEFMRDEYIPAVHKGPTRVGQVEDVELLQGDTTESSHAFLWLVRWNGLKQGAGARIDDEKVERKFEKFGATMEAAVAWHEVGEG